MTLIIAAALSSRIRLVQVVLVIIILLLFLHCESCSCSQEQQVCSGSCGVHNITHPFRLKDDPKACGDSRYGLICEANQLMLYLGRGKYRVQSINYNNFTIRLVDANLPHLHYLPITTSYSLGLYNFSFNYDGPYQLYQQSWYSAYNRLVSSMLYVSCPNGVDFSGGVQVDEDGAACINSSSSLDGKSFYHVNTTDKTLEILGLGDSCRVEFIYLTSWPDNETNISCTKIRDMLLYGFELSWMYSLCKEDEYLGFDNNNKRQCKQG